MEANSRETLSDSPMFSSKKQKRYLEKIIIFVKILFGWVFFPWVLIVHFQTAGAESDISRFSNKDKKILMCHYIAGCS